MRMLIATPTYPPDHGGPAHYAQNLKEELHLLGHSVVVRSYTFERRLPSWVKHFVFFLKTMPAYVRSDAIIALDPMIVGFPVVMLKFLFGKTVLLRIGGDFLWEQYVERTGEKILLSDFYASPRDHAFKDRIIFMLTKFVLRGVSRVIFSTAYQRDIWSVAYAIPSEKISIIENRYEPATEMHEPRGKVFVYAAARKLVWKNADIARQAFSIAQKTVPNARLEFVFDIPHEQLLDRVKEAYAVMLTSLGDISPNLILRALTFGKPVILTAENGLRERIGDAALYVDPLDENAIARAIVAMCDQNTYAEYRRRVAKLSFTHTYEHIAKEFLALCPNT